MKKIWSPQAQSLIRPYRRSIVKITLLGITAAFVEAAFLIIFFLAIQLLLNGRISISKLEWSVESSPESMAAMGGLLLLAGVLRFLITMSFERKVAGLSGGALANLQAESMKAHLEAGLPTFWKHKGGELQFHINNLPGRAREFVQNVPTLISSLVMIAMVSLFLGALSWKLFLAALVVGGLYGIFLQAVSHHVYYLACGRFDELGKKLAEISHEALAGIRQVKVFQSENRWTGSFRKVADEHAQEFARHRWWTILPQRCLDLAMVIIFAAGLFAFAWSRQNPEQLLASSVFITFVVGVLRLAPYLVQAGRSYGQLSSALPSVEAYYNHLDHLAKEPDRGVELPFRAGDRVRVDLQGVSFGYRMGIDVLKDVSITLEPKSVTALVGLSGSGKSTLVDLILGLVEPRRGEILCNDRNVREIRKQEWLKGVSLSSQDTFLFHDTIENNLRVAAGSISREEVMKACRLAGVTEFVRVLPNGLDSMVGDRGLTLSGGQRQRLALARALLKPAEVLILDEPTSALDPRIEEAVYRDLWPILKERTTLIIAHNLSAIQRADRIYVLMDGAIQQAGTHGELISEEGVYRDLFRSQSRAAPSSHSQQTEIAASSA